ncbi:MAG TPA: ribonuclease, partial [Sphingomicrobium sp.]
SGSHGRNAIAVAEGGTEYLLPRGAPSIPEGARLAIEVTRSTIPGSEPWKRPLARVHDAARTGTARPMQPEGRSVQFPAPRDELGDAGWDDLIDQARTGLVTFAGGDLRISVTPAMTLIDVDGYLAPDDLARLGAMEAARAIRRLDIGGSIGVDLPTVNSKSARQHAAEAIDDALPQPFERTAVNGFGFVQIVRPRSRASFLELAQDRAAFEARALLRRIAFEPAGPKTIVGHPRLIAALEAQPEWLDRLSRQLGGAVGLRADASLPMSGGYAEQA